MQRFKKKKLIISTAILTAFLNNGVMAAEQDTSQIDETAPQASTKIENKLEKKKALEKKSIEVIEVTGLRGSLETAQFLKRHSSAVIEVISAEDIGQFADASLTDALERVPGVQIERDDSGQSGDRISIRGLGGQFTSSTINNRMMLSAGNGGIGNLRSANYNVLPSMVFAGVEVRKTSISKHPEPGMAGQVDKQTLRPLDSRSLKNKSSFMRVGAGLSQSELADNIGKNLSTVLAFKNDDESLGWFLAATKSEDHRGSDQIRGAFANKTFKLDGDGDGIFQDPVKVFPEGNAREGELYYPDSKDVIIENVQSQGNILLSPIREETQREAVALGLQWRPTDDLDIMMDVAYTKSGNEQFRERGTFVLGKPNLGPQIGAGGIQYHAFPVSAFNFDGVGEDAVPYLLGIDYTAAPQYFPGEELNNPDNQYQARFNATAQALLNETTTTVGGINLIYYGDRLTTEIDVYYSGVRFEGDLRQTTASAQLDRNITFDVTGRIPLFTGVSDALLDPASYQHTSSTVNQTFLEGDHYGAALDFNYALGWDYIDSVDFGVRYHTTTMELEKSGNDFANNPGSALQITPESTDDSHQGTPWEHVTKQDVTDVFIDGITDNEMFDGDVGFTEWASLSVDGACKAIPEICSYTLANGGLPYSKLNSFTLTESAFAAYAQINLDGELSFLGDMPFTGNIGLRAVESSNEGQANRVDLVTGFQPIFTLHNTEHSYWNYLPSLNLKFYTSENSDIRFAMNKTMSRGSMRDISPLTDTRINEDKLDRADYYPTARVGNPDLKPMTAISYDLSFAWYNEHKGAYIASVFYKDISDYILIYQSIRPLPDSTAQPEDEDYLWKVTEAVNFNQADVKGYELGFYQPFTFLDGFLSSFGARGNYTWVDSNIEPGTQEDFIVDSTDPTNAGFGIPGVSEHNVNLSVFYQTKPLTVRLTYVYRNDYFRGSSTCTSCEVPRAPVTRFTEGNSTWAINANYNINGKLRFNAAITNLSGNSRRDYNEDPGKFNDYYTRGRGYRLGMSYSF